MGNQLLMNNNLSSAYILNESFSSWAVGNVPHNTLIDGWNYFPNLSSVADTTLYSKCEIIETDLGKALTFRRLTNSPPITSSPIVSKIIPAQTGSMTIEARIRPAISAQTYALVIGDSTKFGTNFQNFMPVKISFNNLTMGVGNNPTGTTSLTIVDPIVNTKWYDIKIVLNLATEKFNLWIDGVQKTDTLSGTLDFSCQQATNYSWVVDTVYFSAIGFASTSITVGPALDYIRIY